MWPPVSLEKFLQEIMRAGRSGEHSSAVMYYNNSDIAKKQEELDQRNSSIL